MEKTKNRSGDFILYAMLVSIVLGVFCGWVFGEKMLAIKFLGDIFMNALRAVIIPLIMASMIVGVSGLGDVRKLGFMGGVTLVFYLISISISVFLGLLLSNIIQPGVGVDLTGEHIPQMIQEHEFHILDLFMSLIPTNIFAHMANMDILPIIVASLIFGGVLTTLGKQGEPLVQVFQSLDAAMMKIVHLIMYYAPIGVFALIAATLGAKGGGATVLSQLVSIGKYVMTVLTGLLIHACIILPLIILLVARRDPLRYMINMGSALTMAFSTSSSAAALPMNIECVTKKNHISTQTASFVLPIGATVNMDGTALYEACAAMFIAQAYNVHLSLSQQIIVFLTASLASVGAAAIPQAGLFTMIIVLESVGLPIKGIGLILAVDWFLDRCRTVVNIWGDAVGAAVVEKLLPPSITQSGPSPHSNDSDSCTT